MDGMFNKNYPDEKNNIIYFKHENNSYKFVIKDRIEVSFNDSQYIFEVNKKTLAQIRAANYSFDTNVFTKSIDMFEDKLKIVYEMDFTSFKSKYTITLKWH